MKKFPLITDRTSDKWYAIYDNVDWHPERHKDSTYYDKMVIDNRWTVSKEHRLSEITPLLNDWFICVFEFNHDNTFLLYDGIFSIKKCDEETKNWLHDIEINVVSLDISVMFSSGYIKDSLGNQLYSMLCIIHSIDDLVYGCFFNNCILSDLLIKRSEIQSWVDKQDKINGQSFINFCISKGADEKSVFNS